eukprot:20741-Eustigmatos_ZCMA.PRE.1
MTLPEVAIKKALRELADPVWATGAMLADLLATQKLVGRLYRVTIVRRVARAFLAALMRLLGELSRAAVPGENRHAQRVPRRVWERVWFDFDFFRTALAEPEA